MARLFTRIAATAACAAALSLAASPAMARGWHGGYRHHRGGVDGGDILAGVLILGGIAAVASAASNNNRDNGDYRYRESYPYPDNRPEYRGSSSYSGAGYSSGTIDSAVNACVGEVERGQDRVAAVDNASRTTDGWRISGQLDGGSNFNCAIDNDGRIRSVDLGDGYSFNDVPQYDSAAPGQWDDDAYARARSDAGYPGDYSRE
jgi:hypothetical protein